MSNWLTGFLNWLARPQIQQRSDRARLSVSSSHLSFKNRNLSVVQRPLGPLDAVEALDLSGNQLTEIPEWIEELTHIRDIDLSRNGIRKLSPCLFELRELQTLRLNLNLLTFVPPEIGRLTELRTLDLQGNQLTSLPDSLGALAHLQRLDLSKNALTSIPDCIANIKPLEVLDAENNHLDLISPALETLTELRELYLQRNPRLGIPKEILGPSITEVLAGALPVRPAHILQYYCRVGRPLNEAKLLLVGRGEVGKTSLVNRLLHDRFDPGLDKTQGIEISHWNILLKGNEAARLHLWDFGGQELMHATHQFFLTERSLYILVLNGRESGEDLDVEYWLKLISSFGGDSPVIVVLNKIRSQPFELNRRALIEKYPGRIEEFVRTDCRDGTGITELRDTVLRVTDKLSHLRDPFPASWFAIKERLASMDKSYLEFRESRNTCCALGETDERAQDALAVALHCLGIALNYRDDPRLRDTHVLNPRWVTNGIYTILNAHNIGQQHGVLTFQTVKDIFAAEPNRYPSNMHSFLVELMRKFELCFSFPEPPQETFLVPQLLGKEQADLGDEFDPRNCLNFEYRYPVFPDGLLPRFIVRTHPLSNNQKRWRTGAILEFEGNRALVKADPQEKTVSISIEGPAPGRRRLLAVIRSDFERIHSDIRKLNPVAMVPLPDDLSIAVPYDELLTYERNGYTEITRASGGKIFTVDVKALLDSVELPARVGERVRVFISYSHKDDHFRAELETHLKIFQRTGLITTWHDRRLPPGVAWKNEIDSNLKQAHLVILLISADFIASDYCSDVEFACAMQRRTNGAVAVLPVIIRHCVWQPILGDLQALPENARPVQNWHDRDEAWLSVAKGIERAAIEMSQGKTPM